MDRPPDRAPTALLFGEALIDVYPDRRVVAGAPLHLAVHLAARGWRASLVTRLGTDGDGERITRTLDRWNVDRSLVETDAALPTGTVTIRPGDASLAAGAHQFEVHRPAAWDAITGPAPADTSTSSTTAEADDPANLLAHDLLYYGTLAGRDARSRATLLRLLERSRAPLRLFDPNLRPPQIDDGLLAMGLRRATVLKVNADEYVEVARRLTIEATPAAYFAYAPDLTWLCLTRGGEGASLYQRDGAHWHIGGGTAPVADTVGAGDAFAAGLADALARGALPPQALAAGRAAADAVLAGRGGLPPGPAARSPHAS